MPPGIEPPVKVTVFTPVVTTPPQVVLPGVAAIVTYGHPLVNDGVLNRMPDVRVVSNFGVGVDHIDVAACEGRDPIGDFKNLNRELSLYSKELMKKPQVIALNKIDLPSAKDNIKIFKKSFHFFRFLKLGNCSPENPKDSFFNIFI